MDEKDKELQELRRRQAELTEKLEILTAKNRKLRAQIDKTRIALDEIAAELLLSPDEHAEVWR